MSKVYLSISDVLKSREYNLFVNKHYNKYRHINSITLEKNRKTKQIKRIIYDGYIFDIKTELGVLCYDV